ncbi:hypothetical protein [Arthrobacter woluwensis]|uniref:hypothetical protein n=1 Tax=Arthrobacter woluwensis TaxID=156980 RepID=UPI0011A37C2A|nr:hypothetical protein [Arthrobacter woluwensis]
MEGLTWAETEGTCRATTVLLEGVSDVAAVRAVAQRLDVDLSSVQLVDLGGVTNVRRVLLDIVRARPDSGLLGLCDAGEVRFVLRALDVAGIGVAHERELPSRGFFVCRADLEEELIRALGTARTVAVIEGLGLGTKLATLQQQPAWQGRPLAEQLHRFCGVASGRKELLAGALAAELKPSEVPVPLRRLAERMARA